MVLATWTAPDIAGVLEEDIGEIPPSLDVNNNIRGTQFLFSDSRYADQLHAYTLRSSEYAELSGNYDGYALY